MGVLGYPIALFGHCSKSARESWVQILHGSSPIPPGSIPDVISDGQLSGVNIPLEIQCAE